MKQKKMFRKGTEDVGKKSAYNKLHMIKDILRQWQKMKIVKSQEAILRISNILEDEE